jgi:hypothetical protein
VILATLLASALSLGSPAQAQILNLSCVEALVAAGQSHLAGVFSFVPEKDAPNAFADLIVHDRKALKKYVAKLEADLKEAGGISTWDHEVLAFALTIYGSPLAQTLDKPGKSQMSALNKLALAPSLSLQDMTARRRKR